MQRRIISNSIQDNNEAIRILLDMAKIQGGNHPESSLVIEALTLFVTKYEEAFQTVLNGLVGQEDKIFLCFSKVVLSLDYNKKRQAVKPLVGFLTRRDNLVDMGVKEVYDCLVSLGNEKLSQEIVNVVSPYLDSSALDLCAIIFSVRLCAKFANHRLLPNMLRVLDKSMRGYFDGHSNEIEGNICEFLGRVGDAQCLTPLIKLLKLRSTRQSSSINEAIARVLNANPLLIDDVLDVLYDEHNENVIDDLLQSIEKLDNPKINAGRLLSGIHIDWWRYPTKNHMHTLLVKCGKQSKSALLEILRQDEPDKYDFALQCLKAIGVSNEEISAIFPKPPILQIYNYFYKGSKKIPGNLDQVWREKEKLGNKVNENITFLDHLLFHIFASCNFVTLNVDPAGIKGIDIVCFCPETLDIFIIGCTTGVLKDDLAKMDALIKKMKAAMTELFEKCSVTPIVVCSEIASISPSDAQYAFQNKTAIMERIHIDTLLEMLNTNRQSREVVEYIKRNAATTAYTIS